MGDGWRGCWGWRGKNSDGSLWPAITGCVWYVVCGVWCGVYGVWWGTLGGRVSGAACDGGVRAENQLTPELG